MRVFFADTWNRKPSFLFSRVATRKDALADDGSSQEPDGGEYYENEEYEEEDDSRDYEEGEEGEYEEEFEEDVEAEEEYEEGEEVSIMPRTYAIEDDEIEEVVDEFGSEPAEDSERLGRVETGGCRAEELEAGVQTDVEDAEAEEEYEEGEEVSTMPRTYAIEDDEIEEVVDEFGSEPAEDSERLSEAEMDQYGAKAEGEYEEEETEKDDTDTERIIGWKIPMASKDEDPDRSLGSTVLLPSQPTSFANKRPASPDNLPSDPERTPVPEDRSRLSELLRGPMAVDEEPKERGEPLDAVEGARSNSEVKGSEVTEELDELPEASDLVIIEDGEDEESGDDRSTLYPMLPDSVYDRSSIARDFAREATVETVEWDGDTDALSEGVRIALEGVEGSSESGGEPLQSEDPVESNEEVELAEDLDEVEEVVVRAELDSEDSDREDQSAEESAEEGEPGPIEERVEVVEQTEEANLHEGVKSAILGIDLAGRVETEECQAEELEAGVQADVEDAIDSEVDIPDNISEEPVALVGLGHQYNDDANSAQEPEEKQQNQTPGIEVIVEIDHARQITPVSENTATPPPQSGVTPAKRQKADAKLDYRPPGSPLSDDSLVQQGLGSVGDDIQSENAGEAPAPAKKRIRKRRSKRRRKSGIDPLYVPSPQELEQDAEEETDSDMDQPAAKRQKSKAKSTTTTPAKPFKLGEQLESDLKAVEAVAAVEVASAREKREEKFKQGDGSVVPMLASEEAGIPPGIELRDGKVVQPPPLIVTSPKRTRRGQSAEPEVFSRENSEEPEVRALRNRNVVVSRRRSVSVEPSAGESDTGRAPKRTKRGHSTQPAAPSRDNSEEPEVRALRNRTVIVNRGRSASVELSASETDTAGGGSRRKTRSAKTAVPEAPSTPKKKGKKAMELPLSSIKEAVAENSPKKSTRATRKK